jgi:hypothetical protein
VVVVDGDGAVLIPQARCSPRVIAAVEQERWKGWIIGEVAAGAAARAVPAERRNKGALRIRTRIGWALRFRPFRPFHRPDCPALAPPVDRVSPFVFSKKTHRIGASPIYTIRMKVSWRMKPNPARPAKPGAEPSSYCHRYETKILAFDGPSRRVSLSASNLPPE